MEDSFYNVSYFDKLFLWESFTNLTFYLVWLQGVLLVEWSHKLHRCGGKYVIKKHVKIKKHISSVQFIGLYKYFIKLYLPCCQREVTMFQIVQ